MSAFEEIRDLDAALALDGEDVVLRRVTGTTNQIAFDCDCRAFVRGYQPHELVAGSGIAQGDSKVIISPTQINATGWPGARPLSEPASTLDPRVPRRGDKIMINGKLRTIEAADPKSIDGQLVRLELQVRG